MATHCAYNAFSFSPSRELFSTNSVSKSSIRSRPFLLSSITNASASYNTLVSEAVRLLGPPARFEASKLKVVPLEDHINKCASIIPRTYILSHCDFTANLTLTVSNVINLDQLRGWYKKDDVVAEWKKVKNEMCLHVHCFVCGPNPFLDIAAEFRYHIFSKEMPLVLKAIRHGDSVLFSEHPELLDSIVRVYFHSSSKKYNKMECWGALKDAMEN
ncbi:protein STAY-GREEN LIKE, chloroplastic isoform X2 [Neltuma alba]|uniref:protein STAY-GREEN LIKE, chloroplastic isoform X2 n=1 Tax=Neltuma alba TaxID=207710 RepID=UPI0010A53889|nr:protein STAY-GREEN LIKE, chloroplastic-like isoform X2 [Prosopis alba]